MVGVLLVNSGEWCERELALALAAAVIAGAVAQQLAESTTASSVPPSGQAGNLY